MTFINKLTGLQNYNININSLPVQFKGRTEVFANRELEPYKDSFSTNPLYEDFGTKQQIEQAVMSNPRIKEILREYNLPLKINMEELEKLKSGHLKDTRVIAAKIYSALPQDMKAEVNPEDLQTAALYHDFGKILIPKEILNKPDALTKSEKEIVDLHSELGYELLKSLGVKPSVLKMIKNHHQSPDTEYTRIDNDVGEEILQAADKYSALTEERSYKGALPKEEALKIIYDDVGNGRMSEEVYTALEKIA